MTCRTSSWLGLTALGVLAAACGQQANGTEGASSYATGGVRLGLAIAEGVDIDAVDYAVDIPGQEPITGSWPVPEEGQVFGSIVGVPPSEDVSIALSAGNAAGVTCAGSGTVAVRPGETSETFIVLQCRMPDGSAATGKIEISGGFNICPQVMNVEAVADDAGFAVSAEGSDLNEDALTYAWEASAGSFGAADAATTTYACDASGEQVLTVTVDDGQGCSASGEVSVTCAEVIAPPPPPPPAPVCGDGNVDDDEECDDGNTEADDGCAADCTIEVSAPEPACGDGNVDEGEECDDGNTEAGDGCSAECSVEAPPNPCGNGTVDDGEECDDGNNEDGDGCSAECLRVEDPAVPICDVAKPQTECEVCACNDCKSEIDVCNALTGVAEAGPGAGQPKADLCRAVVLCGARTGCRGEACFCGALENGDPDLVGCLTVGPAGPCQDEIAAAAETAEPVSVQIAQLAAGSTLNVANSVSSCMVNSCAASCE